LQNRSLVDKGLAADGADDADPVLQSLLVDVVVVLLERTLTAEVLVAAAERTPTGPML
jgi:hypothetical protein